MLKNAEVRGEDEIEGEDVIRYLKKITFLR